MVSGERVVSERRDSVATLKECVFVNYGLTWVGPIASLFTEAPQAKSISLLPSCKSRMDTPDTAIVLANSSLTVFI